MNNLKENLLGIYEKALPLQLSWKEKFEVAKKAGFDFIELSIDGYEPRFNRLNWTDDYLSNLKQLSINMGMPFKTMALTAIRPYPLGDIETHEKAMEIVKKGIHIAKQLSIELIQIPAYDVYKKESTNESKILYWNSIRDLLKVAEKENVVIAIEVLEDVEYFNCIEKARKFIKQINNEYLGVYGDTGNVAYNNINVEKDLEFDDGIVKCCHLKDAVVGNEHNIPYGEGIVDFEKCLNHFRSIDYDGCFVAECWSEENQNFIPNLREINKFLRSKIKGEY